MFWCEPPPKSWSNTHAFIHKFEEDSVIRCSQRRRTSCGRTESSSVPSGKLGRVTCREHQLQRNDASFVSFRTPKPVKLVVVAAAPTIIITFIPVTEIRLSTSNNEQQQVCVHNSSPFSISFSMLLLLLSSNVNYCTSLTSLFR